MDEITKHYYMTRNRPHASWAISLTDVHNFERDVPGIMKTSSDVFSRSDPWLTRLDCRAKIRSSVCRSVYYVIDILHAEKATEMLRSRYILMMEFPYEFILIKWPTEIC